MQTLRGKGKIYNSRGDCLSDVDYEIHLNGSSAQEWWGEITPREGIMPMGSCMIELENGQRGPCAIRMRTNSSFGLVIDSFDILGSGPLGSDVIEY
jgi:hypothetical protein